LNTAARCPVSWCPVSWCPVSWCPVSWCPVSSGPAAVPCPGRCLTWRSHPMRDGGRGRSVVQPSSRAPGGSLSARPPLLVLPRQQGAACGIPSTWQRPTARRPGRSPGRDRRPSLPGSAPGTPGGSPPGGPGDATPGPATFRGRCVGPGHPRDLPARRGRCSLLSFRDALVVGGATGRGSLYWRRRRPTGRRRRRRRDACHPGAGGR
jgi:hypothetical protein